MQFDVYIITVNLINIYDVNSFRLAPTQYQSKNGTPHIIQFLFLNIPCKSIRCLIVGSRYIMDLLPAECLVPSYQGACQNSPWTFMRWHTSACRKIGNWHGAINKCPSCPVARRFLRYTLYMYLSVCAHLCVCYFYFIVHCCTHT